MARKSKTPPPSGKKPAGRRKKPGAADKAAEPEEEQTVAGVENTIVGATSFCLMIALALLIMASGRY